jgi:hypothetical protein
MFPKVPEKKLAITIFFKYSLGKRSTKVPNKIYSSLSQFTFRNNSEVPKKSN